MTSINNVCLRTKNKLNPTSIDTYKKIGGYKFWMKIIKNKINPEIIINEIKESGLRGRGGAGFPTGLKISFMPKNYLGQKYIICNSDEGEPGTCKDREILLYNPHQIIEGMAIIAYTIGATIGYNYIRGEFYKPIEIFEKALDEAKENGYLGLNIKNSGINFILHTVTGAGAYICGEETALLESIEGKRGYPRIKPPLPVEKGLYNCPTNINNTETYASIPIIMGKGASYFNSIGTDKSPGSKIFCISGSVNNPNVFETELGIKFQTLLAMAGGVKNNLKLKAIIPGGNSSQILTVEETIDLTMDYESLAKAGSMLGTGAIIVISENISIVKLLYEVTNFYYNESCGQCTPCREGVGWMAKILTRIINKNANKSDLDDLLTISSNISGTTICGLGDAASWPVQSYITKFKQEFIDFIYKKKW